MFSVINLYVDHLKFFVVCTNGRGYVCCSECSTVFFGDQPTPVLCNLSVRTVENLCTLGFFALWVGPGFLNCDNICMCVVKKQFELLEFVFNNLIIPEV